MSGGSPVVTFQMPPGILFDPLGNPNAVGRYRRKNLQFYINFVFVLLHFFFSVVTLSVDVTPPSLLSFAPAKPLSNTAIFNFVFSKAVLGVTSSTLLPFCTNCQSITVTGSGSVYSATVIPSTVQGSVSLRLPAGVYQDVAGITFNGSGTVSMTYDATVPTVTITARCLTASLCILCTPLLEVMIV